MGHLGEHGGDSLPPLHVDVVNNGVAAVNIKVAAVYICGALDTPEGRH
jgi:hypothetical protein